MNLLFRGQSTAVKRKAKARPFVRSRVDVLTVETTTLTGSDIESVTGLATNEDDVASVPLAIKASLPPTIDERATGWFFAEYVIDTPISQKAHPSKTEMGICLSP